MPIVIKELAIKVNVEESASESQRAESRRVQIDSETVVDACVEKVIEILDKKNRR